MKLSPRKIWKGGRFQRLTFELVVIRIDDAEVLLRDPPGALVLVHPQDRLEHLHHLVLGFVPHGAAGVDAGDVVGRLDALPGRRAARLRVDGNRLVILVHSLLQFRQILKTKIISSLTVFRISLSNIIKSPQSERTRISQQIYNILQRNIDI